MGVVLFRPGRRQRGDTMIIVLIVMAIIAVAVFMLISGNNRKRKRQNPAPYVSPEGQNKGRASGLD
jgi:flagellar basal body-associated protein FliL